MKKYTILDCYTDEPSGLGVPPYIGTYPRYLAGKIIDENKEIPNYITIDDLRGFSGRKSRNIHKTDIKTYNKTKNYDLLRKILAETTDMIIILGVHTPGKYLSAVPGTLSEVTSLIKDMSCRKILTGPAVYGTQLHGGRFSEKIPKIIDEIIKIDYDYGKISDYSVKGSVIIKQIPDLRIAEIETGKGCSRKKGCSFCTEPIKNKQAFRKKEDIIKEIKSLVSNGITNFRLGKQSDFYSYPEAVSLLKDIRNIKGVNLLHIDNVNPAKVLGEKGTEITKAIVKYCSDGNVAAFGVESFDKEVVKANNLNCTPETALRAIEKLNKLGGEIGERGLPKFLPGINILFGLINETKETHNENMRYMKMILEKGFSIRRINIRQVVPFEGTMLYEKCFNKYLKKNRKYYWKWRDEIRKNIDIPMLKRVAPIGTVIKEVRTEIHDGSTTFARQIGTYPLIIGIKEKLDLNQFIKVRVKDHMLRSIVAEKV